VKDGATGQGGDAGWRQLLGDEPWAHDFFAALSMHEALADGRPRLGDSAARREEYLDLGQVPHLDFAASAVASYEPRTGRDKARLRVKSLGLLGPMGPLPAATTEEALRWFSRRDDAFARFLDIFNNRFLQLFFRAHSDARPASHRLRPRDDRFRDYVGAAMGIGAAAWRDLDSVPDLQKLAFAGLLGARATSASRVEHFVTGIFGIAAEVEQFVGSHLPLAADEQTRLGAAHAVLGDGALAGRRVLAVDAKFRLRLFTSTLSAYENFLPAGAWFRQLTDAISNAVGPEYEWDVELVLPDDQPRPAQIGAYGRLGWTSWVRKQGLHRAGEFVRARFSPAGGEAAAILSRAAASKGGPT
jgi:type VI secretion system protein ImpH